MQTMLVRLKPYNPRRGFVTKRFTYRGVKFQSERGWYRVEKEIADYLRGVKQIHGDEHSPDAFDVKTPSEAERLEEVEESEARAQKSTAEAPTVQPREDPNIGPAKRGRGRPRKNPKEDANVDPKVVTASESEPEKEASKG